MYSHCNKMFENLEIGHVSLLYRLLRLEEKQRHYPSLITVMELINHLTPNFCRLNMLAEINSYIANVEIGCSG